MDEQRLRRDELKQKRIAREVKDVLARTASLRQEVRQIEDHWHAKPSRKDRPDGD